MSRPRVLVLGLNYAPEQTGIAPYTAGMASGLTEDFDVDVVTAHPHYPEWRVADGYGGWRSLEEIDGVRVHRVKHYLPRTPTGVGRILSEAAFTTRALAPGVARPDVIISVSPALAPVASALTLGRRWGVPVGVVVQDLYSKAFAELGLLGGKFDGAVHRFERALLRRASGVVAIHQRMADVISRDFGLDRRGLTVIPNWTHVTPATGDREARRRELGWDDGRMTVVHAGNMGAKQGLEHLLPVAQLLDDRGASVRLVLIGNGGQRVALEELGRGIRSLEFMDALPAESFMDTLAAADALLLHERPGMKEMCVPSKLTTYFAAARPVVAVTEAESAAAHEVTMSGAGTVVTPGEPERLADQLEAVAVADLDAVGFAGLKYAREALSADAAIAGYRAWVLSLLSRGQ
ncbi:glycosyltransferase [Nocardioides marinus]|uniref:Glycosyltransferase involved in cell wall biosynthesis n=1 Tax=Nocardioides marinus TaxID=374514 RepID=A0A7Z0C3V3_9ACTN|nr:glycosyltransferase [Nocardioides marinus]NYI11513.1 glycosyltransferase involved in cell wall biosynthesis [Nocardioides marinus]